MSKSIFTCSHCDAQYTKWVGRCLECGKWGSIAESFVDKTAQKKPTSVPAASLSSLTQTLSGSQERIKTSIKELDQVLGGGLVTGSFILLGGEPGIGKSTLSLQMSASVDSCIYISGEESIQQIGMRAKRLGITKDIHLLNETTVEKIVATIEQQKNNPLIIIDSIQTLSSIDVPSEAGSVTQVRSCATKLLSCAKTTGCPIILIGHVTKDGNVAGPRTLEHLVDTVLYLEGDRYHNIRMLRAVKNRFGSTDEVGMFEMEETGLVEVSNPSALLLEERGEPIPGSVVTCLIEGTRPLLVEVQALVNKTSFGYPVRKASGFDLNRLHVLIAVLEKRASLALSQYDVHVNIVGGIKANEPAADLAVALAIASAYKDKTLGNDVVVFGEVGLGGEIRSVKFMDKRIKEAEALGMKRIISTFSKKAAKTKAQQIHVKNILELVRQA